MPDLLRSLNQRPVVFYPLYRDITGSITSGIVLSQLMYWFSKMDKFYKTDCEILKETGLSENELRGAKNRIKKLAFISVTREGIPSKTFYEIDWEMYEKTLRSNIVRSTKPDSLNQRNCSVDINETITESTTESTTKRINPLPLSEKKEPSIDKQKDTVESIVSAKLSGMSKSKANAYLDWFAYRAEIKKPFKSVLGIKSFFTRTERSISSESDLILAVEESMANGYQGLFLSKYTKQVSPKLSYAEIDRINRLDNSNKRANEALGVIK